MVDNDAFNSVSGYVKADVNSDDFVDASDLSLVDNNAFNSIQLVRPKFDDANNIYVDGSSENKLTR